MHLLSYERNERGSSAIELAIMAVVLIVFTLLIVGLGRMTSARFDVTSAANEAARAASLESDSGSAVAAGQRAAARTLRDRGVSCTNLDVSIDTTDFTVGGSVTARVQCVADLSDITLVYTPGSRTFTEDAAAPIEQYRAGVG